MPQSPRGPEQPAAEDGGGPHPFHIHIPRRPVDLWAALKRCARRNERTFRGEALVAIKAHLIQSGVLSEEEIRLLREYRGDEEEDSP